MKAATGNRVYPQQPDDLAQLTTFRWPIGSYRWMRGKELRSALSQPKAVARSKDLFLVESSSEARLSTDVSNGALFREFADTPMTPDGVLGFANKHGWLGAGEPMVSSRVVSTDQGSLTSLRMARNTAKSSSGKSIRGRVSPAMTKRYPGLKGEQLQTWLKEIATMHRLVRTWEPPYGAEAAKWKFEQSIRRVPDEQVCYEWQTEAERGIEVIASKHERPWLLPLVQGKKHKEVLRWYLQIAVNERLAAHDVKARLLRDERSERLQLNIAPGSLIGFLWLQFAKAIEGGTAYRRCEDCARWFELGGRSARADKRFCSGTCKARSHRKKKQTSRTL